jgi:hypothetical protein
MEDGDRAPSDGDVLYAIQLERRPPASLRSRFPSMKVRLAGAQTVLRREVSDPVQLDALLQDLRSVGLVLTDAHRLTSPPHERGVEAPADRQTPATYEVRVAGELGTRLVHYLRCSHFVVPEQVTVQLVVDWAGLTSFVKACSECGARIERVRRIGPAPSGA